jgi:hypothetical protein
MSIRTSFCDLEIEGCSGMSGIHSGPLRLTVTIGQHSPALESTPGRRQN